jgi:hypothetical protein
MGSKIQPYISLYLLLATNGAAMSMDGPTAVAPWFAALPLSDPRCRNDSCTAFYAAHNASQTQISWASQFNYGRYVVWYYTGLIGLFFLLFMFHMVSDRRPKIGGTKSGPNVLDKLTALVRLWSYRRVSGKIGAFLGLPSFGVLALMIVASVAATAMAFAQHPYYR